MLIQLHHQFKERTEMCAQRDISGYHAMRTFVSETKESHPLPEGAKWIACMEGSKTFVSMEEK